MKAGFYRFNLSKNSKSYSFLNDFKLISKHALFKFFPNIYKIKKLKETKSIKIWSYPLLEIEKEKKIAVGVGIYSKWQF